MKITRLEIKDFGKLENLCISFGEGFNAVYGGNETGKSTLQAFIKAMLYGLKGGRASSETVLSPINKYRPWRQKAYGGTMEYKLDNGESYRVERDFDKATAKIYDYSYNDISASFKSQRDKLPLFAEKHFGMDEACFEKTVFVRQLGTRLDGSEGQELKSRLSNIAQTGFENISFGKAEKALKDALKTCSGTARTAGRATMTLEERLKQLEVERAQIAEKRNKSISIENRLKECEAKKAELLKEKEYLDAVGKVIEFRKRLEDKKKVLTSLKEAAAELREAQNYISALESGLKKADATGTGYSTGGGYLKRLAVSLVFAAAAYFVYGYFISGRFFFGGDILRQLLVSAAVFILVAAALTVFCKRAPATIKEEPDVSEPHESRSDLGRVEAEIAGVTESVKALESELNSGINCIEGAYSHSGLKVDFFEPESLGRLIREGGPEWLDDSWRYAAENVNKRLMAAALDIKECQTLSNEFGESGRLLQSIDEEIEALMEEKMELEAKGAALRIALDTLYDAAAEMAKEFSPGLNARMSEIAAGITAGRYASIKADDMLRPMVVVPEVSEVKNALLLSGGTVDQIYLALRIAAADMFTKGKESLPLILDEAFAQYDDDRVRYALEYFKKDLKGRQVILFTCKRREMELVRKIFGDEAVCHML